MPYHAAIKKKGVIVSSATTRMELKVIMSSPYFRGNTTTQRHGDTFKVTPWLL